MNYLPLAIQAFGTAVAFFMVRAPLPGAVMAIMTLVWVGFAVVEADYRHRQSR